MGINCPNVQQVVPWGAPANIELYMQETGRAGRDGQLASAVIVVVKADFNPQLIDDDTVVHGSTQ